MWVQPNAAPPSGRDIDANWVCECSCVRRGILLCAVLGFSLGCPAYELSNSSGSFLLSELQYFQSAGPWGRITLLKHSYRTVLPWFFFVRCGPHTLPSWRRWQSDRSHCTPTLPLILLVALALQNTLKMSKLPFIPSLGPFRCAAFCQQCTASFFLRLRYGCRSRDRDKCSSGVVLPHFRLALGKHSHEALERIGPQQCHA